MFLSMGVLSYCQVTARANRKNLMATLSLSRGSIMGVSLPSLALFFLSHSSHSPHSLLYFFMNDPFIPYDNHCRNEVGRKIDQGN